MLESSITSYICPGCFAPDEQITLYLMANASAVSMMLSYRWGWSGTKIIYTSVLASTLATSQPCEGFTWLTYYLSIPRKDAEWDRQLTASAFAESQDAAGKDSAAGPGKSGLHSQLSSSGTSRQKCSHFSK